MFESNLQLPIKRALISVSDKTSIVELARELDAAGVQILATGGTFTLLQQSDIAVTEVSDYTGFPEMMDGRVKTLHPKIHGGLLGRRLEDQQIMAAYNILPIDLLVVNLYPFAMVIDQPHSTLQQAIENIDIGGPAMLRSAAKNHRDVAVVVDAEDYSVIIDSIKAGGTTYTQRFKFASKAFAHTASYDKMIANYLHDTLVQENKADFNELLPQHLDLSFSKVQDLRYGENSHQRAAFYKEVANKTGIASGQQLQGKELSYNNIADADLALECVKSFAEPACVIVKHAMPCGVAEDIDPCSAYERAFMADSESAFGGVIAFNRELNDVCAKSILERQFVEVIIVPAVTLEACAVLATKPNIRLVIVDELSHSSNINLKKVGGGLLVQTPDKAMVSFSDLKVVTKRAPTAEELGNLLFAWKCAKFAKSNAIVFANNMQTIGIGQGQTSRVNSARLAQMKAEHAGFDIKGAVMASDAFFPFRDGIDTAASVGISAVIQPGGSMRDDEVIEAANEAQIAMVFTGMRHFRH